MVVHPKVAGSTLGGALSVIVVWILSYWVQVPVEVAGSLTVILGFVCGYLTPLPKEKRDA